MTPQASDRPVAIVTGASSGIGAACATRLAADGFNVIVNYMSNGGAAEAVAQTCRDKGSEAMAMQGDVAGDGVPSMLVGSTIERWNRLDVVVNNAGVTTFVDPNDLDGLRVEDFERIFAVNVTAAYEMVRVAAPYLRTSPVASVVHVTSHSGVSGLGSSHAYAASKGAANTLVLGLARSLAPEIRVNAVCPGYVDTPWHARRTDDPARRAGFHAAFAAIAPLKRLTTADDVAEAVSFFASGARAITGAVLVVDGGTHLTIATPQTV